MIIDIIICRPDGTQEIEKREVADDWFAPLEAETTVTETAE